MMHFKTIDLVRCWCRWNGHVQTNLYSCFT